MSKYIDVFLLTEAYVLFCAFVVLDFQSILLLLQSVEPVIHLPKPAMCKLLNDLPSKFIKDKGSVWWPECKYWYWCMQKGKTKSLNLIGIGTKAKLMFSAATFLPDQK